MYWKGSRNFRTIGAAHIKVRAHNPAVFDAHRYVCTERHFWHLPTARLPWRMRHKSLNTCTLAQPGVSTRLLLLLLLQDSTFSYNTRPSINPACCGCTSCVCPPPAPAILLSYWSFAGHTGTSLVQLPGASATMILENVQLLGSPSVADWLPPAANYMDDSHTWVPGSGGAKYPGPGQGVRNGGAGAALAISESPGWGSCSCTGGGAGRSHATERSTAAASTPFGQAHSAAGTIYRNSVAALKAAGAVVLCTAAMQVTLRSICACSCRAYLFFRLYRSAVQVFQGHGQPTG